MREFFLPVLGILLFSGCNCRLAVRQPTDAAQFAGSVAIYGHRLQMRLFKPAQPPDQNLLIVYATGDGGWGGLGSDLFSLISQWRYPTVGFSSKNYLQNLGYHTETDSTTPRRFVRDLQIIIKAAREQMGLPDGTQLVLVGLSRGAGLMVVAAGDRGFQSSLAGVIAVALTREEEHLIHLRPRRDSAKQERVEIKTYEYLRRLATLPVSVIQSTHDGYLPAKAARALFGPDTAYRKFHAVEARNHSFWCGCDELRTTMDESWRWIRDFSAASAVQ